MNIVHKEVSKLTRKNEPINLIESKMLREREIVVPACQFIPASMQIVCKWGQRTSNHNLNNRNNESGGYDETSEYSNSTIIQNIWESKAEKHEFSALGISGRLQSRLRSSCRTRQDLSSFYKSTSLQLTVLLSKLNNRLQKTTENSTCKWFKYQEVNFSNQIASEVKSQSRRMKIGKGGIQHGEWRRKNAVGTCCHGNGLRVAAILATVTQMAPAAAHFPNIHQQITYFLGFSQDDSDAPDEEKSWGFSEVDRYWFQIVRVGWEIIRNG